MALFTKKTWKNRKSEYPARRILTKENGTTEIVTVARSEGIVSEEGDAFSEANMNDLESRVLKAIGNGDIPEALGTDIVTALTVINSSIAWVDIDTSGWVTAYTINFAKYNPATKEVWINGAGTNIPNGRIDTTLVAYATFNNIQQLYRPSKVISVANVAIGAWVTPITTSSLHFRASANIGTNGVIMLLYPVEQNGYHLSLNLRYIAD